LASISLLKSTVLRNTTKMLTAREVSRLAGFNKPWMLNHLEREEIFVPETPRSKHHGKYRNYTFRDLVVLRAINRLLQLGARPKRIMQAMAAFAAACPEFIGDVSMRGVQVKFATESGHFVVGQDSVIYCNGEEFIDLLKNGQLAFAFMVDATSVTLPCLKAACEVIALPFHERRNQDVIDGLAKKYAI
jgi:DNA-binding transcriptional MerR regulator